MKPELEKFAKREIALLLDKSKHNFEFTSLGCKLYLLLSSNMTTSNDNLIFTKLSRSCVGHNNFLKGEFGL